MAASSPVAVRSREAGAAHTMVRQGVFFALFRLASISELAGPETAVRWADSMLEDTELMDALAADICEHSGSRPAAGAAGDIEELAEVVFESRVPDPSPP